MRYGQAHTTFFAMAEISEHTKYIPTAARVMCCVLLICNMSRPVNAAPADGCGVFVSLQKQHSLFRERPISLEPGIVETHASKFGHLQSISSLYTPILEHFGVTLVHNASMTRHHGRVLDRDGRDCSPIGHTHSRPSPIPSPARTASQSTQLSGVALSLIQQYSWMYYHFISEVLPRLASLLRTQAIAVSNDGFDLQIGSALAPYCNKCKRNASLSLLVWGRDYEHEFLRMLGIPANSIVPYGNTQNISAPILINPTATEMITPQQEGLHALRSYISANQPSATPSHIVYCSRSKSSTRRIANEREVLHAISRASEGTELTLTVYEGNMSVPDVLELFSNAAALVGPHGAGLSHIVFAPEKAAVVELHFMSLPPMMFFHIARALQMAYAIAPLPHSYWGQSSALADPHEVVALLERALPNTLGEKARASACEVGSAPTEEGRCVQCSPGTYSASVIMAECKVCLRGRAAPTAGMDHCINCNDTAVGSDGTSCKKCPEGEVAGGRVDRCGSPASLAYELGSL